MNMGVMAPYEISRILTKTGKLRDIIFISSMYGIVGPTPSLYENFEASSPVQYGVVKAAQIHLSKELAVRFKPVRVNTISYGGFEGRTDDGFKRRYAQLNPSGRMLLEHDVYGPIDMILNYPDMAFTGQNIVVDGGWTTW
jgi:NAD(P)-dependent dehydrogenase (short-subunit alcohol dehydrogenase family)